MSTPYSFANSFINRLLIAGVILSTASIASDARGQVEALPYGKQKIGETEAVWVASPSPYPRGLPGGEIVWAHTFHRAGSTFVRVHVSEDSMLAEGDSLIVRDRNGAVVQTFSGAEGPGRWTYFVDGASLTIELIAQDSGGGGAVIVDMVSWGDVAILPAEEPSAGTTFVSICDAEEPSRIRLADPVARLLWTDDCGGSFTCTGWLFSPRGHLMTNAHCANSQSEANNLEVRFNFQRLDCDRNDRSNPDTFLGDITFVRKNCDLDYAVFLVHDNRPGKGNPADIYGYFSVNPSMPVINQELWLPQHPQGLQKQIAESCFVNDPTEAGFNGCADPGPFPGCNATGFPIGSADVSFDCPIAPGSSGSPVLNLDNEVIAIAHATNVVENFGVRMSAIVFDIPNEPLALTLIAPPAVDEGDTAALSVMVDNLILPDQNVTNRAEFFVDPVDLGMVDGDGNFTAGQVATDRSVVVTARYTVNSITVEDSAIIVIRNTTLDTPIIDIMLTPSVDPTRLALGQSFSVDVSLATDGDPVSDVRLIQFDTSLTDGTTIDAFTWDFENLVNPNGYFRLVQNNVHSATYTLLQGVDGWIVNLTSVPQRVARLDLTFTGNGELNLLGVVNPPTQDEGVRFISGFVAPVSFSQSLMNVSGGTLGLMEGDAPPAIVAGLPPDGAIDARQPTSLDGSTVFGWIFLELTFDADVSGIETGDFEVTQIGGFNPPPTVTAVTPLGATSLLVELSQPIEPGARTTVRHVPSDTSVTLSYLPGDVNGDGTSSSLDIIAHVDHLNGVGKALSLWSTDCDRSGLANSADIIRLIDLLNGAGAFDPWNNVSLP